MNRGDRDYDELLRRALHEAADWLEPSDNGLDRIRARLTGPRSTPVAWMTAVPVWWAGLRAACSGRSRRWQCAAALLSVAVVAGAAGALALTPLPRQAASRTGALIRSFENSGPAGGAGGQGVTGSGTRPGPGAGAAPGTPPRVTHRHQHAAPAPSARSAPSPAACRSSSASPSPSPDPSPSPSAAACPSPSASPSPGASASPSPSPSPSSSPSPSPSPSASPSPSPTPSPGGSLNPSATLGRPAP
jgi:hypothetical protein